jgi:hypothetical protein
LPSPLQVETQPSQPAADIELTKSAEPSSASQEGGTGSTEVPAAPSNKTAHTKSSADRPIDETSADANTWVMVRADEKVFIKGRYAKGRERDDQKG